MGDKKGKKDQAKEQRQKDAKGVKDANVKQGKLQAQGPAIKK